MQSVRCPALFVSAPGSNHGKTTVTAALARYHRNQERRVRVFKTGPDFLDPMILECASGNPVYQLDLWMAGEQECRRRLHDGARDADLILIEGVMGLFDGEPSSADLAAKFGVPVLAVINAAAMAQTFGAVAHGLVTFRPGVPFAGVLANGVGSARHAAMLTQALPPGIRCFGALPRSDEVTLSSRHLGLTQAEEISDLDARLESAAAGVAKAGITALPPEIEFTQPAPQEVPQRLKGIHIAVARDAAFSFLYPANLECLRAMGVRLSFFSPLADAALPEADGIYLPGGYPELHLQRLQQNDGMKAALRKHFDSGRPIYAECGGMLYLLESLTDSAGGRGEMVGLIPGHAVMQRRVRGLGYQTAEFPDGVLRGHTFHHSVMHTPIAPAFHASHPRGESAGEAIYRSKRLIATYVHFYFPSNPTAAASLFAP